MISYRQADLIDRVKQTIQYVGMPIRVVFSSKPGESGVVSSQDASTIKYKDPAGREFELGLIKTELHPRNGRVYYVTDAEKAKYQGYSVVNASDGGNLGLITEIREGYIYTSKNKKIDANNWGMSIQDSQHIIRINK